MGSISVRRLYFFALRLHRKENSITHDVSTEKQQAISSNSSNRFRYRELITNDIDTWSFLNNNYLPRNHRSHLPSLFFWICPIHAPAQTSISHPFTLPFGLEKICMEIFYQLFQIYPHNTYYISNLGVNVDISLSLTISPIPYSQINQKFIWTFPLKYVPNPTIYHQIHHYGPVLSPYHDPCVLLSEPPTWSAGLQSCLQNPTQPLISQR